jgi:hypothetical protein
MIKESITIKQALKVLNRAVKADPIAMAQLADRRVWCNKELADDPTIQVQSDEHGFRVGIIGLVNGMFGTDKEHWGTIAATFEVICPRDHNHEQTEGETTDSECKQCGTKLENGQLLRFVDLNRR